MFRTLVPLYLEFVCNLGFRYCNFSITDFPCLISRRETWDIYPEMLARLGIAGGEAGHYCATTAGLPRHVFSRGPGRVVLYHFQAVCSINI
jgi:hypothetical protein